MINLIGAVKVTKNKMIKEMYETWKDDTANLREEVRGLIANYNKCFLTGDDQRKPNEEHCTVPNCKWLFHK